MEKLKLVKLDIHHLQNAEFGQFINRFLEDFQKAGLSEDTDADFKQMLEQLKTEIPTYQKALEKVSFSEESKKISQLDRVRDNDLQALRDSIKPYRYAKTDDKKNAFGTLKAVLDQYKEVTKEPYEAETIKIGTLLSTLKNADNVPLLALLKITEFVDELEKSNKEFNDVFANRSLHTLQKESFDAKTLRKNLMDIYRKLCGYILTLANIKQDEYYKKVLETINNSRKYYTDMLSIREGKKKATAPQNTPN